ncbi:MAG: hypothetical protein ACK56F_07010, partial [bacterium]
MWASTCSGRIASKGGRPSPCRSGGRGAGAVVIGGSGVAPFQPINPTVCGSPKAGTGAEGGPYGSQG